MRRFENIMPTLYRVIIAVASVLGCYGIGHCMSPHTHWDGNHNAYLDENHTLSYRDSLIHEMVDFIQPDSKLSKSEKRHIENRINGFQHRVVRRDTISYFLNAAYAVAYYEFYKHDYKKAKKWVDEFDKHGMPAGLFPSISRYTSLGLSAGTSLNRKGKFREKKDKNSWYVPIKFSFADSLDYDARRTPTQFIGSYLDDVPMDCDISSYNKLLRLYKEGGGRLEWLNGYSQRGFVQRCVDAGRVDILNIIYKLWDVELEDFKVDNRGYLGYNNPTVIVDSASVVKMTDEILSFDPKHNQEQIDSLLANHNISKVGTKVLTLLSQYYGQSRFVDVVNVCEKYNRYLVSPQLNTLHNYWGLALSNLGKFEEALRHYDIAIATSIKPDIISTMRLNKACTLGEMGRTDEAVAIFMTEKDSQKTPFERFVWNDNLGYVYSFINPTTALYYYNQAERFLDSGTLYPERKVRHFCRKAQVSGGNKYLQRLAIDEALKFTLNEFCPDIAKGMAYTELGCFNATAFDYEEADENFRKAYQLLDRLTKEDKRMAYLNLNYAQNLCNLDQYDEAASILIRQLHTTEKLLGQNCREYAETLRQLIIVVCQHPVQGLSPDSLYNIYTSLYSPRLSEDKRFNDIMLDIVYALYKNNWTNVEQMVEEALNMELPSMQRLELITMYENACREHCDPAEYNRKIQKAIPLIKSDVISGLLLLTEDERRAMQKPVTDIFDGAVSMGANEIALDLSLFRKGLLFATRQAVEQRLAHGRKTKQKYQTLVGLRGELNAAIEYNDTIHIPRLASSVTTLERELSQMVSSDKEFFNAVDKNLAMVTSSLGPTDLAVDFVRYGRNSEARYGGFIINKSGLIKFVRLGRESELRTGYDGMWQFLSDGFSEYSTVYFSTDGLLNNIGIEYLSFEDGTPVSSVFKLHRVFHLSEIKPATYIGDEIVAIGVSDHNSPVGSGETIDRGSWTDLPNVKYEMQLISKTLEKLKPHIMLNDEVSEPLVNGLSGTKTSTLHISTHGFYRNSLMLENAARDTCNYDYNLARRCLSSGRTSVSGLILRQGNLSWQSPEIIEEFDDLLTSEEIELMTFPNLQLTVLSACETGLGDMDPDGVWGLQRAFRIAGTKSLICSLTKVDDYWTAQFMDAFYEQAEQGNTIYESFHTAQRWLRHELPDNPEIWTAFILIE